LAYFIDLPPICLDILESNYIYDDNNIIQLSVNEFLFGREDGHVPKPIGSDKARRTGSLLEALGAEITERRKRLRWTQQKLADTLGYNISYIGLLEQGARSPTLRTLIDLADVFEESVSSFIRSAERRMEKGKRSS
jgi:DNA-binding XRE family transcriptional regulator